jgi:hypothetical protein
MASDFDLDVLEMGGGKGYVHSREVDAISAVPLLPGQQELTDKDLRSVRLMLETSILSSGDSMAYAKSHLSMKSLSYIILLVMPKPLS